MKREILLNSTTFVNSKYLQNQIRRRTNTLDLEKFYLDQTTAAYELLKFDNKHTEILKILLFKNTLRFKKY